LFFWFINDLPHAVQEAKVVLIADNTNIQDVWMKGIQNKKNDILETNFHAHIKVMSSEKENSSFFFFVLLD
jgi:hypothetical protein